MKLMVRNIEIIYSKNQEQYVDSIKGTIEDNYELIFGFLGKNKVVDISNGIDVFYDIIKEICNSDEMKNLFSNVDLLPTLYLETLIRREKKLGTTIVELYSDMSDELLSSMIAYKYFEVNGTFDDFVEYLKLKDRKDEISKWLQNVSRWDTYNYLLKLLSNILRQIDDDTLKQLNHLINNWVDDVAIRAIEYVTNNDDKQEYQKISMEEFDSLFYEFLNYIQAPGEWLIAYNNLKENKLILVDEKSESSMCYQDDDGVFKILLENCDDLRGFCDFVHEFIHYVSRQNGLLVSNMSITEFPSIFFETLCAEFLKEKGYSSEIVDQILNSRGYNNFMIFISMRTLFADLMRYLNCGVVSRDDKIALYQEYINSLNEVKKNFLEKLIDSGEKVEDLDFLEEVKRDIETMVDEDCDSMIVAFVKDGLLVINGYQYLIATYLANNVLEKLNNDDTIISKMVDVTNNLGNVSIKNIIELFNIKNILEEPSIKKLVKNKND